MRDVKKLHPLLQGKIDRLLWECRQQGISIKIGECVRSVAEQDALYAKGRTTKGKIVTNAKGKDYQSMHQWGVAFDFFLNMDIDGDRKTADDAFNNKKKTFDKVGAIGKKVGLEWGGDWESIKDLPHFQLPYWGSTTKKLRNTYKKPNDFRKKWNTHKGPYTVRKDIILREVADFRSEQVIAVPQYAKVVCVGVCDNPSGFVWLKVKYKGKMGYVSMTYLR